MRTRRSLDERLMVRWPRAYGAFARVLFVLPPRSRLRRALLRRQVLSGWSAFSRADLDLMLVRYAADYRFEPWPEFVDAGVRSSYTGHAGLREMLADIRESWEQIEMTPHAILDAGDRFVVLGRFHIRGRGSGVDLESPCCQALWFERGLVVRDCQFQDCEAALRAACIPTDALARFGLAPKAGTAAAPN
jgi:hypothetical protein